jgi:hypothetical protein
MLVEHEFCRKKPVNNFSNSLSHPFNLLSMKKNTRIAVLVFAACAMARVGYAGVTLTDIGAANPTPGPNDIYQLSTSGNITDPGGLNYYTDDHVGWHNGGEPGQTFTTGTSPAGYVMTSIALKTGGLDSYSGIGLVGSYDLHIFSVSGASATLLQTYTASISSFNDGDWLRWTNLAVPLATNAIYAWSFGLTTDSGYEAMAVGGSNPYSGGQIALIPVAGGTMTFGNPTTYDAVFDIGLATNSSLLLAGAPTVSPALTNYIGATVTLGSAATGDPPLQYQWQTDGGSGGTLNNILNATNASLTVTPTNTGAFRFDYIVTNITGRATSSVAVVTIIVGTPIVSPASTNYIGSQFTLTSPAVGSLTYQWQTDGGSGGSRTNIPGANSVSLTVTPASTGTFNFDYIVNNGSGSFTSSVAPVTVLSPVTVAVNVSQPMAAMPAEGLGVCTAVYDNVLINSAIAPLLKAAGITALRYPGGSYSDIFNWQTTTCNDGGYVNSADSFDNFMNTDVNPAGAKAVVTVNYGSNPANNAGGDPNVAAAWVAHANVTNNWGVKYWEIGNEVGGNGYYSGQDWEYDLHFLDQTPADRVGQPALSPAAYGTNSIQFISAMKAFDPTIKCGVGFNTGYSPYNTSLLGVCGSVVDFVIIHYYPGTDAPSLLAAASTIPATVQNTYTQLTNDVGAAHASQMQIAVTETGAGSVTGAPVSLFAADNYLTWIENGVVNVDYQILHDDILLTSNQQPGHAYYGAMMAHLLANIGDTFLKITSSQPLLRVHATTRQDGKTGVMLVNTDPIRTTPINISINGATLAASGTCYQFGLTNFIGANDYPSYPVSTNTVSGLGNSFTVSVPPYTMVDLLLSPANTPPVLAPIGNQTVNVGQTVAFTASATDTNQPPPTLTFSLLSGVSSATLNTNSGAFSWRPAVTNANTTNAFTIEVADNGTPSMSATQSFTVTVNPLTQPTAASIVLNNGQLGFQVSGQTGPDYAVQVSSNLFNWSTLFITNSPPMPFTWTDTNAATLPVQFYRIKVGPPLP